MWSDKDISDQMSMGNYQAVESMRIANKFERGELVTGSDGVTVVAEKSKVAAAVKAVIPTDTASAAITIGIIIAIGVGVWFYLRRK